MNLKKTFLLGALSCSLLASSAFAAGNNGVNVQPRICTAIIKNQSSNPIRYLAISESDHAKLQPNQSAVILSVTDCHNNVGNVTIWNSEPTPVQIFSKVVRNYCTITVKDNSVHEHCRI